MIMISNCIMFGQIVGKMNTSLVDFVFDYDLTLFESLFTGTNLINFLFLFDLILLILDSTRANHNDDNHISNDGMQLINISTIAIDYVVCLIVINT